MTGAAPDHHAQVLAAPPQPAGKGAGALARDIARRLRQALRERGRAVLGVSGGRSPVALFETLSRQPLDWSRVTVTLVDERCVPAAHEASNARLVREHLLQGPAAAARLVPLVPQDREPLPPPPALAEAADAQLRALGPADVLVLGMGADGHTASLFPQARNLRQALDPACARACLAMELDDPPPQAPFARLSQTLAHLLASRHLVLLVGGADKLATLQRAMAAPCDALPVSRVIHQHRTPLALWISP